MQRSLRILALSAFGLFLVQSLAQAKTIEVVCTLPPYAAIAKEIAGPDALVRSMARGDEDAHFVKPKPSLALMLRTADLFVTTGLDLELWAPLLIDKSGNRTIHDGQPGFVSASAGIPLLDKPSSTGRSAGDVHIYGNPHITTSPLNAKIIAANIAAVLERVDPANTATYRDNLQQFQSDLDRRLYGEELLKLLDSKTLDSLARQGKLHSFLASQQVEGRPLLERAGGWLQRAQVFWDEPIVVYHKNWIYFTQLFGLKVAGYIEPKPGIPPSARHVFEIIQEIKEKKVPVILVASYFSDKQPKAIAERTGARAVFAPLGPDLAAGQTYAELVDQWVEALANAFGSS